jgi:hypothetical protein
LKDFVDEGGGDEDEEEVVFDGLVDDFSESDALRLLLLDLAIVDGIWRRRVGRGGLFELKRERGADRVSTCYCLGDSFSERSPRLCVMSSSSSSIVAVQ